MSEPTACDAAPCSTTHAYCDSCDLFVGLDGLHVIAVERDEGGGLVVMGVRAGADGLPFVRRRGAQPRAARGRTDRQPCFGRPTRVRSLSRRWACREPVCPVGVFTGQDERVARPVRC